MDPKNLYNLNLNIFLYYYFENYIKIHKQFFIHIINLIKDDTIKNLVIFIYFYLYF